MKTMDFRLPAMYWKLLQDLSEQFGSQTKNLLLPNDFCKVQMECTKNSSKFTENYSYYLNITLNSQEE